MKHNIFESDPEHLKHLTITANRIKLAVKNSDVGLDLRCDRISLEKFEESVHKEYIQSRPESFEGLDTLSRHILSWAETTGVDDEKCVSVIDFRRVLLYRRGTRVEVRDKLRFVNSTVQSGAIWNSFTSNGGGISL